MPRLRFGLRVFLCLPICVAAFYLGWTSHATRVQSQHEYNAMIARQRNDEVMRNLTPQKSSRVPQRTIDEVEQLRRIQSLEDMMLEQGIEDTFPSGAF